MLQLEFEFFDGRSFNFVDVIDKTTGEKVGRIESQPGFGISVKLFGGKYRCRPADFHECKGFVKGVEAVLNQAISAHDPTIALQQKISDLEDKLYGSPPRRRTAV